MYSAFDEIAKKRGVFKVETIGDSYVAVVGLPRPRRNHAIVMARFASDCLASMRDVVRELETVLGPIRSSGSTLVHAHQIVILNSAHSIHHSTGNCRVDKTLWSELWTNHCGCTAR
jgi:Adenylate and Guanylate cyclase catalytic domain